MFKLLMAVTLLLSAISFSACSAKKEATCKSKHKPSRDQDK
jgi:hypothetical protein